jgi:hypothetical protein
MASLMHPGHPLMQSVTDLVMEQHRNKLKQGAVLVDPSDMGLTPRRRRHKIFAHSAIRRICTAATKEAMFFA